MSDIVEVFGDWLLGVVKIAAVCLAIGLLVGVAAIGFPHNREKNTPIYYDGMGRPLPVQTNQFVP